MNHLLIYTLLYSYCNSKATLDIKYCIKEKTECVHEQIVKAQRTYYPVGYGWPVEIIKVQDNDSWVFSKCFGELLPKIKVTKEFSYKGVSFTQEVELVK